MDYLFVLINKAILLVNFSFQKVVSKNTKGSFLGFTDPDIMKKLQVDRGAIKFVLAGANIMCPGLTSPGGALDDTVAAETPVV